MTLIRLALLSVVAGLLLPISVAHADGECESSADLEYSDVQCKSYTSDELFAEVGASSGSGFRYRVRLQCLSQNTGAVCNNPRTCPSPPNTMRYDVTRSENGGPFLKVGEVCLNSDEAGDLGVITTAMVARAFKNLSWPTSRLVIQPPGGRTLVNFETNFSTTNTDPQTQAVTLLGQRVEIEATPTSWVWHYGDGESEGTDFPGASYPDLEITHVYLDADVVETPSLDTVYSGRYRINGGPWQDIPDTVTVAGAPVNLEVVEARPVLVGSD